MKTRQVIFIREGQDAKNNDCRTSLSNINAPLFSYRMVACVRVDNVIYPFFAGS